MPEIHDVVFVDPDQFDSLKTEEIGREIGFINARLRKEGRRYLLIGPGRWGTSDPCLGIPVSWHQVSEALIMVELALPGFDVEPSQGTHFFQNLTSLRIGYLTIDSRRPGEHVDWNFLARAKLAPGTEDRVVRHVILEEPLEGRIDGRTGIGIVLKSQPSSSKS